MSSILYRLGADTRYTLLSLPLSIIGFTLVVTGLALGAGLLPIAVGIPIAAVTLRIARGFAMIDRAWLSHVQAVPTQPPYYRPVPADAGAWARLIHPLRCAQSWGDALGAVLRLPVVVVAFSVTAAWWGLALGGLLYPLYGAVLERIPGNRTLAELAGLGEGLLPATLLSVAIGVAAAFTLPAVARFGALLLASVGQGPRAGAGGAGNGHYRMAQGPADNGAGSAWQSAVAAPGR
ncbi:hypothetical protein GCM10027570_32820 [Streptomonospora sediminis]